MKTHDFKYFWHRGIVVFTMVMLMFISAASALLLSKYSDAGFILAWPALGDFVLPLCFVLLAQIFRNRVCAVIAVLLAFVSVFFRLTALFIRKETFMPLGLDSLMLLWEHADHQGMQAVFGKLYYLWMIPLGALVSAVIIFFCIRAWKASRNKRRVIPDSWITIFAVLFAVSIAASCIYVFTRKKSSGEEIMASRLVRPVPVVVAELAGDIVDMALTGSGESGFFPENMPEDSAEILSAAGIETLKLQGAEINPEPALFDRIIIIAAESLDLAFIGAYNPQMPPELTPELNRIYKENLSYVNCFTAAQPTSWGLTALLMSRLDYRREVASPGNPSLFSIGEQLGYQGFYFSPVSGHFGSNRENYLRIFQGNINRFWFFEEWKKKFSALSREAWGLADVELFDLSARMLEAPEMPEKFIAVISTIDIHPPYTINRKDYCKCDFKSEFLNSLHCFDCHLGDFIKRITANPKLYNERTLIVLTADHSATHGENYLKRSSMTPDRIPLIFITPDRQKLAGLNPDKYCSSIDVAPTMVRFIGGRIPRQFMGRDLRESKDCAIAYTTLPQLFLYRRGISQPLVIKLDGGKYDTPLQKAMSDYFHLYYKKNKR